MEEILKKIDIIINLLKQMLELQRQNSITFEEEMEKLRREENN